MHWLQSYLNRIVHFKGFIITLLILSVIAVFLSENLQPQWLDKGDVPEFQAGALYRPRLIIIDPGHGGPDPGASSPKGTAEKDLVLEIGKKCKQYLDTLGFDVLMTRTTDTDLSGLHDASLREKKRADLKQRVEIINKSGADLLITLHANAIPSTRWHGAQVFYRPDREENKVLATCIQNELIHITDETTRSISISSGQYILEKSDIPAVNIEVGFLSNPREARLLEDDHYQHQLAWAITIGILRYFNKTAYSP